MSTSTDKFLAKLIEQVALLQVGNNRVAIADGAAYSNAGGFILYVGVAGDVNYTTFNGQTGTQYFLAGYHIGRFTAIGASGSGTTAIDLAACY